jgi:hypothetical protein
MLKQPEWGRYWRGLRTTFPSILILLLTQCTAPKSAKVRGLSDSISQVDGAYGRLGLGLVHGVGLGVGK